jgi:hypothetical protein
MKTIHIKIITGILFFIFHFSFFSPIIGQIDTAHKRGMCNSLIKKSKYIFEGKIDSSKYITVQTGQYTYYNYMSYSIEVNKVIKGNLQKGTVEILQQAIGVVYKGPNGVISGPKNSERVDGPPAKGVYFCFDTTRKGKPLYFKSTNNKTLRFFDGIPSTNGEIKRDPRGGLGDYFSTLSDFYNYITSNCGVKIQ